MSEGKSGANFALLYPHFASLQCGLHAKPKRSAETNRMSKPSVFMSYRNRDAKLAERVASALKHLGFDALDPTRDLRPGENWRKAIQSAIRRSDAVIMVALTPQA